MKIYSPALTTLSIPVIWFLMSLINDLLKSQKQGVMPLQVTQISEPHKHEWEQISKTQAPPRRDIDIAHLEKIDTSVSSIKETVEKVLFGLTELMWECIICHDHKKEYTLGSDISQLDELIDKADRFGPQYIQRTDGTTFVITKYQQQVLPSGAMPLR